MQNVSSAGASPFSRGTASQSRRILAARIHLAYVSVFVNEIRYRREARYRQMAYPIVMLRLKSLPYFRQT
jgi:hypothetical protein